MNIVHFASATDKLVRVFQNLVEGPEPRHMRLVIRKRSGAIVVMVKI